MSPSRQMSVVFSCSHPMQHCPGRSLGHEESAWAQPGVCPCLWLWDVLRGWECKALLQPCNPPAPEPLASPAQKRENAHLKSTRCLQMFKVLQLGFDSCVVLAQGIFLQRNMILKNSNNPILISLITFIKAIV